MSSKLVIFADPICDDRRVRAIVDGSDVLALSPTVMLMLEKLNVQFRTVDDYYDLKIFRQDVETLIKEGEHVFALCDDIIESEVAMPFAYSGNIVYFLMLISDLLFLDRLTREIKSQYSEITVVSANTVKQLDYWDRLGYLGLKGTPTPQGGLSMPVSNGITTKLALLNLFLELKFIATNEKINMPPVRHKIVARSVNAAIRLRKKFPSAKQFIEWTLTKLPTSWFRERRSTDITSLIIQDGCEVVYLKKYLGSMKVNFRSIAHLRGNISKTQPLSIQYSQILEVLQPFFKLKLPVFYNMVLSVLESYHREVVGRLPSVRLEFEKILDDLKPDNLLFSIGDRDVLDSLFGVVANRRNIPVLFFQHGGVATRLVDSPFHRFIENSKLVKNNLILSSRAEADYLLKNKMGKSTPKVLGSISQYEFRTKKYRKLKRALYPTSLYSTNTFRSLVLDGSDREKYRICRTIIRASKTAKLPLDIKIHPTEQDDYFDFFTRLVEHDGTATTRIIYGIPGELIIKNYDLIVLDFLPSTLVPYALSMDVPIVCCLPDLSLLNDHFRMGLKKRCYFVDDLEEMVSIFSKFVAGNLASKWTLEFIDEYINSLDDTNPIVNMANYLNEVSSR